MTHYIYIIENKINGKFYIGRTGNPSQRKRAHFSELRRGAHSNPRLQNAFNKYGEAAFDFRVVEVVDELFVQQKEKEWFYAFDCNKDFLYNCHFETTGGMLSHRPLTEEMKNNISKSLRDRTRKYIFDILDEGYARKVGLITLAKRYKVGSTTLLDYKEEWEILRGKEYGHPQIRTTLERLSNLVNTFRETGVIPDFKEYGLTKRSLDKHLHLFGMVREDFTLDKWKQEGVEKALTAIRLVKETGCSVLQALRETGATSTTYYKYLKENKCHT